MNISGSGGQIFFFWSFGGLTNPVEIVHPFHLFRQLTERLCADSTSWTYANSRDLSANQSPSTADTSSSLKRSRCWFRCSAWSWWQMAWCSRSRVPARTVTWTASRSSYSSPLCRWACTSCPPYSRGPRYSLCRSESDRNRRSCSLRQCRLRKEEKEIKQLELISNANAKWRLVNAVYQSTYCYKTSPRSRSCWIACHTSLFALLGHPRSRIWRNRTASRICSLLYGKDEKSELKWVKRIRTSLFGYSKGLSRGLIQETASSKRQAWSGGCLCRSCVSWSTCGNLLQKAFS